MLIVYFELISTYRRVRRTVYRVPVCSSARLLGYSSLPSLTYTYMLTCICTCIFSEPFEFSSHRKGMPLLLNISVYMSWKQGPNLHNYSAIIKVREFTMIQYYHLIHRPHSISPVVPVMFCKQIRIHPRITGCRVIPSLCHSWPWNFWST
jgi:hypothetical protein